MRPRTYMLSIQDWRWEVSHKDLYCRKCNIQFENREELDEHLFSGLDSRHLPKPPAPPKAEVREWLCKDTKGNLVATIDKLAYIALEAELALARSQVKYSVGIHDELARLTGELEQANEFLKTAVLGMEKEHDKVTAANERAKGLVDALEKYKNQSASVQTIDMAAREALDKYKGEDK